MQPETTHKKRGGLIAGIIVIVLIALITVFAEIRFSQQSAAIDQTSTETVPSEPIVTPIASGTPALSAVPPSDGGKVASSVYKDGTYSATGSYVSPGGPDHVGVTLTLANDVITDITVTPEPGDRESAQYQSMFVANYKPLVIGKDITTVHLSKVSGSSLTSGGFNDALSQIEAQAKA